MKKFTVFLFCAALLSPVFSQQFFTTGKMLSELEEFKESNAQVQWEKQYPNQGNEASGNTQTPKTENQSKSKLPKPNIATKETEDKISKSSNSDGVGMPTLPFSAMGIIEGTVIDTTNKNRVSTDGSWVEKNKRIFAEEEQQRKERNLKNQETKDRRNKLKNSIPQ
jgi:hypothetical protein